MDVLIDGTFNGVACGGADEGIDMGYVQKRGREDGHMRSINPIDGGEPCFVYDSIKLCEVGTRLRQPLIHRHCLWRLSLHCLPSLMCPRPKEIVERRSGSKRPPFCSASAPTK